MESKYNIAVLVNQVAVHTGSRARSRYRMEMTRQGRRLPQGEARKRSDTVAFAARGQEHNSYNIHTNNYGWDYLS